MQLMRIAIERPELTDANFEAIFGYFRTEEQTYSIVI